MLRAGLGRLMAKGRLTGWTEGVGGSLTKAEGQDRGVVGGDLRGSTTQGWVFFFNHNSKRCLLLFTVNSQTKNKR